MNWAEAPETPNSNVWKKNTQAFPRGNPEVEPLPAADKLLKHLARNKVQIVLAATGGRKQTSLMLRHLKIPAGTPVITGDDVEKAKPSPDIFMAAANQLQVPIDNCIVVGDSVWDVLAGVRKSALAVGLMSDGYAQEELERAGRSACTSMPPICSCTSNNWAFRVVRSEN